MSMRVQIDDNGDGISVTITAGRHYAPDVMADLKARALDTYRDVLVTRMSVRQAVAATEEGEEP